MKEWVTRLSSSSSEIIIGLDPGFGLWSGAEKAEVLDVVLDVEDTDWQIYEHLILLCILCTYYHGC